MTSIIRLARATPANRFDHAPFMSPSAEPLLAFQLCLKISSQRPLSYQSCPRVGTMISSVVISDRLYRSSIVVRRLAYTDATPASTSASVWNALVGVSASCGTSVRFVQPLKMIGAGPQSSSAPRVIRPIDREKIFLICLVTRDCRRKSGAIGARLEGDVCASRERAGSRIRQVIDAAGRHAVDAGVGEHFGVVAAVRREEQQ